MVSLVKLFHHSATIIARGLYVDEVVGQGMDNLKIEASQPAKLFVFTGQR